MSVTISGAGGTLGGTQTVTAVNGVATFTDLTLTGTVGVNYVLQFTSNPVYTAANSANVTVTAGSATQLIITTQPVGGGSGAALTTQPVVAIRDAQGNLVTTDNTTQVTVAVSPGSGTLGGTQTVTAVSGVATFTNLTLAGTVGVNYVLQFTSSPALTAANSNNVQVTPGAPTQLTITQEPSSPTATNTVFAQQPIIQLRDANGNAVSQSGISVTAAVNTGTGTGVLSGTTTLPTAANGTVIFTNLKINKAGDYTLIFTSTSPSLTPAISITITIN